MKRISILIIILYCLFMVGCEQSYQHESTDDTSNHISEKANPSQTDNITETTIQPTVSLMTHRYAWYDDASKQFILVFSLVDENRNEINVPVEVDVSICDNSNQILYSGHHNIIETSYQTWQYNDGTERYQATIYIDAQEVNTGCSEKGTIAFTVYNSEKFVFDEIKLDIDNLPHHNYPQDITLSYTSNNIFLGEQITLYATLTPTDTEYKDITWSSSDESIATVNNGVVTGIKPGIVYISATTTNGINASCQITVSEKNITNIILTPSTLNPYIGETFKIEAKIYPDDATNKTIYWSSSDESIAKVDDKGVVVGLNAGTVNITAKSTNGIETTCSIQIKTKSSIELPKYPIEVWSYASHKIYSKMLLTNISYEIIENRDNTITIYAYFTGEVTYIDFTYANFEWKLYDKDGYVIETGNVHLQGLDVGDKFKDKKVTILNFSSPGEYRLEVSDLKY